MIPKSFCAGIVALGALTTAEPMGWLEFENVETVCYWVFGLFGIMCVYFMYREWKEDKWREWEND